MEQFPGNSHKADRDALPAAEDKPVEQVVTGRVIRRKKPLGKRIMSMFFSGDSDSVFGYLLKDVIVPALQNTITDVVTQGIEKAIFGTVRTPSQVRRPGAAPTRISYNRYASPAEPARRTSASFESRRQTSVSRDIVTSPGEIILEDRIDIENVIDNLDRRLQTYGVVTVADLLNLVGQTSVHTDHNWGWNDISDFGIRRVREGYLLMFPEPVDIR